MIDLEADGADFIYLHKKDMNRIIEYNRKNEEERRNWREEHEKYGKFDHTNYNLDGNMEGLLNFMYWKCDCCQRMGLLERNVF
jgi:hypothetical protein